MVSGVTPQMAHLGGVGSRQTSPPELPLPCARITGHVRLPFLQILRMPALLACFFAATLAARGDTITLKNGRTIVADRVHEKGNHVEYEIGDNTYSILR